MENLNEVYGLFKILEESGRHGETFKYIRLEAQRQLMEIEAGLKPEKPEAEVYEPEGTTEDNPTPAKRDDLEDDEVDEDAEIESTLPPARRP